MLLLCFFCFQIPHFSVKLPHFNIQNSFRVIKMHFLSSNDIFKVYQFSVITLLELAKPDKLTKIIHFFWCIMIIIRFCLRIRQIYHRKTWYEIDMLFGWMFTCFWWIILSQINPCSISSLTNLLHMLYIFGQPECKFYPYIFQPMLMNCQKHLEISFQSKIYS